MSRFNEIAAEIIDVTENVMRAGQRPGAWTFVVDAGGKLTFMFLDSDWSLPALEAEYGCSIFRLSRGDFPRIEGTDAGHLRQAGVRSPPVNSVAPTTWKHSC